jgi:hypothetical protein
MMYTIRYRRPEALWSLAKMTLSTDFAGATLQIARLRALDYRIVDITPPLTEPAEPAIPAE